MDFGRTKARLRLFIFGTSLGVFFAFILFSNLPVFAATGINQTINFQGRLLDSTGATVPDGFYNIQFKIYQDGDGLSVGNTTGSPAGTLKWTENYLNTATQGVKVQNGFLSVPLGSVNAFGSSIDWNQSVLWLSMNIGNTNVSCTPFTSCAPDGEMTPMQPLTSAVYALNANALGGMTAASFGQLAASQIWTGVNTFRPASDSTSAFRLQNQSAGTAYVTGDSTNNQLILGTASSLTGKLAFATVGGGTLTINPTSSASSFTITLPAETGTVCTTAATGACSVAGSGYVQLAPLAVQADGTTRSSIFVNKTNATGNILQLQKGGTDVFTIANDGSVTAVSGAVSLNDTGTGTTSLGGTSNSGTVTIGNSASGNVNLTTGATLSLSATTLISLTSGTVQFTGSAGTNVIRTSANGSNDTSAISLQTGNSGKTSGTSGAASITSGNGIGTNTKSGNATISTGSATGTAASGDIILDTGTVVSGTAGVISLGLNRASAINIGRNGITTTNNGALTATELLTGNLGITVIGATASINASSNNNTNINTGSSTGTIAIGNAASTTTVLGATTINGSGTLGTTIGSGTSTTGTILIQGGVSSLFTGTNATGKTALGFAAPSTAGTVTFQLPAGGTGGTTYEVCTTYTVCAGYGASTGANQSLNNLSAVAINTSLLPGVTNSINVGSAALTFANGFFGTSVQSPLINTFDQTTASTASAAITVRSGNTAGATSNTGAVSIKSGDATTGNSGAVTVDSGTAGGGGTKGTVSIGATNASGLTLGHAGLTTSNGGSLAVVTNFGINNGSTPNRLSVNSLTTAVGTAQAAIATAADTNIGFVIQANSGTQSANLLEAQTSGGVAAFRVSALGTIIGSGDTSTSASGATTLRTGNTSAGSGLATGALTLGTGNGSGTNTSSGAVSIDSGSASGSGTTGGITIGATNSTAVAVGNTAANTTLLLQGGSGSSAIQINQGLGGAITIGTIGSGSSVAIQCGAVTGGACGFANNATDHTTTVGSVTGASSTIIQGGSTGLTFTGNITASGTYNGNTFSSTALTFAGANPVISASTTNTGLTAQANGTGTLTLNTTGAGTVNVGTANSTTLGIGNASSTNTILGATTVTGTVSINTGGSAATTIGQGNSTAGVIAIQGGVGSTFSVTNSSGTSVLSLTAPSTAGIVTYRLPGGGTGGTTYDICTTQVVCTGYSAPGANTALSNLAAVAINTSLLPGVTNTINAGSAALTFASGFFGTSLQSPILTSGDTTAASSPSVAIVIRSGDTTGSASSTGALTLRSGNATTGNSGAVTIDSGTSSGTKGAVSIGAANTTNLTVGNTGSTTTTTVNGGTTLSLQAAASGAISIGTASATSISIGNASNAGNSLSFGNSTNGETVNIENTATTAATTVNILSGVGTAGIATLNIGNNTRITGIGLGNINPAAARTIAIGNATGTGNAFVDTINIATNATTVAGGNTVNIASGTPTGAGTNVVTIGSLANASTTLIQGGTGSGAITMTQATGAGIIIGSANTGSTVTVQCGAGTSSNCGFGTNGNDHSTYVGSTTTVSNTVIQSGTGGINLNGAVTTSGTINTNTFSATALTFTGANPVISSTTTNTGMTLQSNGIGTLTLNSTGAGTVNLGAANTTSIGIGNTGSTNTILGASTITGVININNTGILATTIGQGTGTAGIINIQGGVGSTYSVTNTSGKTVLAIAAPSTAGTVTYQLPAAGVGGTTYDICTTLTVCTGYSAPGANTALSNLAAVAINTSLLPGVTNTINVGSAALTFASGYFGTGVTSPIVTSGDQTAASSPSVAMVVRSGDTTGSASSTGAITLRSGNATTGNSGAVTIDSGTSSGTKGAVSVGAANTTSLTLGNTGSTTATVLNGGTTLSMQAAASGSISIGSTNANSISIGSTANAGNSLSFGNSLNGETINISNGATTAATTVSILSGVGTAGIATLNLGNNTRVTGISLGNINPSAARTIAIGNSTGTANAFVDTINIATNPTTVAGGNTVNIASGTPTGAGTNLVTIGSLANASTTIIQGGATGSGIQLTQGTGGNITVGSANTGSTVTVQCGAGTSSNCGFGTNGNDHSTFVGSTTGVSATTIQSGSGGLTLTGNITAAGTYNGVTLNSTALTFSGANPTISSSTGGTGMTLQSNGAGILTLNSSGAGTVNVGTTNTTTVGVGNTTAATQTLIQGGNTGTALGLQVASGGTLSVGTTVQTSTLSLGNISASSITNISGGTGTTAVNALVGNGGSINIGTTVQTSVQNIGNTSASTLTLINGGTGANAIQLLQGAGGTVTLGGNGAASNVIVQCGAGATSCNFGTNATDHTTTIGSVTTASLTTIQAGTAGIALAESTTLAANKSLTMTSGTGRFIQAYTGTTTDAHSITANSLTTASVLSVTSTNNSASATAWSANKLVVTNSQGTTAATVAGLDVQFTQAATIAGNTESVASFAIAASGGAPTDNTVDTILNVSNNDTATGNLVNATDGLRITAATANNIINAINLNGTFQTNLIATSTNNYTLTALGAVTQAGNLTLSGANPTISASTSGANLTLQTVGTGILAVDTTGAGTVNVGFTNATTVRLGNTTAATQTLIQGGTGASALGIQVGAGGNLNVGTNSAALVGIGSTNAAATTTISGGTGTGALSLQVGTGGTINLGTAAAGPINIGNVTAATVTTISGGTGTTAIQILQGAGGTAIFGGNGTNSITNLNCGSGTTSCNLGSNATDHTTVLGSTTGTSATTIQSGSTISLAQNTTVAATKNLTVTSGLTSLTSATGASDALNVSNSTGTGNIALFKDNATTVFSIADAGQTLFKPSTSTATAFQIQPAGSSTPTVDVDTLNGRLGINTAAPSATLEINSTVAGTSGIKFTQLTSASTGGTAFTGILGLDTSGNVGLSQASVSLTSPALAYWDGCNNPTVTGQSYPLATLSGVASYVGAGSCAGNGVQLTSATNNVSGSINWTFSQVAFEETQFQFKAGGGTGADSTWFYSYADATPTTEFGTGYTKGYIIYFSEFHHCIGVAYGGYTDGNQCGSGGGTSPLASAKIFNIGDNAFHAVDIQLLYNQIIVRWDGNIVISFADVYTRDTSNLNFGFGSRTGGSNNNHYIRGLLVTKLGTNTSQYNINNVSPLASDLYWDNTNGRLGVGTTAPSANLEVVGTTEINSVISNAGTAYQGTGNITACTTTGAAGYTANTTVTGSGTAFASTMIGSTIVFKDGTQDSITAVASATSMTVATSRAICPGTYEIITPTLSTALGAVTIGRNTTDTQSVNLVLDSYSTTTDPTGTNGAMYYNTGRNAFRCYQNSAWTDCTGIWRTLIKASDQSKTSNITLAADTALTFAMAASANYTIRCQIYYNAGLTGDFKWSTTGPTTPTTVETSRYTIIAGATVFSNIAVDVAATASTAMDGAAGSGSVTLSTQWRNGANAGTWAFNWAQNTSNATATIVRQGSYCDYASF